MAATFGLDFGTTNSLISVVRLEGDRHRAQSYLNPESGRPHPSVVWYPGDQPVVGEEAKNQLSELGLGVFGDIVRSPKMFLGQGTGINVGGIVRQPINVVSDVLGYLRLDALRRGHGDNPFECAVITIPVTMRGNARAELRQAAERAGIHIHQFVHEPLAALYGYLRGSKSFRQEIASLERRLVLVFDWGGGTLDLTLCQMTDGILTQVLNLGDREVGGDHFDYRLRQLVRDKYEVQYPQPDWSRMRQGADTRIIRACEDAKISLSTRDRTELFLLDVFNARGDERNLEVRITRDEFESAVRDLVSRGLDSIDRLLSHAGVHRSAVEFCLATGGMIQVPAVRDGLREILGISRLRLVDNAATVISEGAAWIAYDGIGLQLSKPIEILHADDCYVDVIPTGTKLPTNGEVISQEVDMYCVDPSDGIAKFLFARPAWPGYDSVSDKREPYELLTLPVDKYSRPLRERLKVTVDIDDNLVANVRAYSPIRRESRRASVHELEFGLDVRPVLEKS